jgi:hypothetical protein
MNPDPETASSRGIAMEFLVFLGILAVWVILQVWVLPRLGVKT